MRPQVGKYCLTSKGFSVHKGVEKRKCIWNQREPFQETEERIVWLKSSKNEGKTFYWKNTVEGTGEYGILDKYILIEKVSQHTPY